LSLQDLIDLLRKPPTWIVCIIVAILVSRAFHKIFPDVTPGDSEKSKLIFILEIMLCGGVGFLTLHGFLEYYIDPNKISPEVAFNLLYMFIGVTFASMCFYLYANKRSKSRKKN
jgi:hypothetical protein